jgi:multidrug efflux system membrane fusion protein
MLDSMSSTAPSSGKQRRLKRAAVAVVVVITAGWVMRSALEAPPPAAKSAAAVPVTLTRVLQEDVPNFLTGVGTVQPLATVTVKSRIDGELQGVEYREGQDVKAGQVLARLDARPLRAQLEQVRALQARDEAQLANARLDLARYEQLIKQDATSQQSLDTQRALVAQFQASVQTDIAQVHLAEVQLGYATVTAPLSGRTGARLVDPGNIVHAADANGLVVINQIDPIAVVFSLPGDSVQAINAAGHGGRRLPVLAYSRDGDTLLGRGELVLVNNQIDVASGSVQLKARFGNATHALWPGQYVNVRLLLGERKKALTVPAAVVQRSQAGTYAYAVDADGKAAMRPVEVLQIQDGKAVIGQGLQAGEQVILDGQYKVKPGTAVTAFVAEAPAGKGK